ncbi:MAG: hypothetical protein Q4A79_00070 [Candidatus Saccharibacteria bacterium]|nr:hypothetical protein [Candidatus Saccharibacteria bacterium]
MAKRSKKRGRRRRRSRGWIFWVFVLVLLMVAGLVCYMVWKSYFDIEKSEKKKEESVVQIVSGGGSEVLEEKKDDEEDKEIEEVKEIIVEEKEELKPYEGENPNLAEGLSGAITYVAANENTLVIRVNIDQYLAEGECQLSLVKDGNEVYRERVAISGSAASSTCQGFDVSRRSLDGLGGGEFGIIIEMSSGGKSGVLKGGVNL